MSPKFFTQHCQCAACAFDWLREALPSRRRAARSLQNSCRRPRRDDTHAAPIWKRQARRASHLREHGEHYFSVRFYRRALRKYTCKQTLSYRFIGISKVQFTWDSSIGDHKIGDVLYCGFAFDWLASALPRKKCLPDVKRCPFCNSLYYLCTADTPEPHRPI